MKAIPQSSLILFAVIVSTCAIEVFIFSVTSGQSTAIRSWEIVRQGTQDFISARKWSDAEAGARKGIGLARGIGAQDFRVAISLGDLGNVLSAQEKYSDAFDSYRQASEIEKAAGHDTASGAKLFSDSNLGYLYYRMGQTANLLGNSRDAARYLKKSALAFEAIKKTTARKKDLFIAQELVRTVIAQAETAGKLNQPNECLRYYRKALDLCGESYYPAQEVEKVRKEYIRLSEAAGVPAEVACGESSWSSLMQQAEVARQNGQSKEFEKLVREAISSCADNKSRQFLALISLRKLAKFYVYNHNLVDARDACNQGLAIWREIGPGCGGDSAADDLFGYLLRCTTDVREQLALAQSRLELRIRLYGPDDYHIAETSTKVAVLANALGDRVTRQIAMERAFKVYTHNRLKRRGLGLEMIDLGNLLVEQGDYKRAEIIYQRAYTIWCYRPTKYVTLKIDVLKRLHDVYEKLGLKAEMDKVDQDRLQLEPMLNGSGFRQM